MANAKIMIVESDTAVAKDIEERLTTLGYTICAIVSSKAQTIAKVVEARPDLVLIDMDVEGEMDGVDIAQEIYNCFDIPVIYLSNYVNEDLLERVRTTRAFGHVFKPYGTNQLHLSIENHLYWYQEDQRFREGEQQLTTIFNNVSDAVIATDRKGLITFMNPAAESMIGWQFEEASGANVQQIFRVDTKKDCPITAVLRSILSPDIATSPDLSTDCKADCEAILTTRSDQKIQVNYSAVPSINQRGKVIGIVITCRDITDYKAIEEQLNQTISELQNQTQLMEVVFNSMSDGVMVLDTRGQLLFTNSSVDQAVDKSPRSISISEWSEVYGVFHIDKKTPVPTDQLPVIRALQGEEIIEEEFFIRNINSMRDNHPMVGLFVSTSAFPLLDENQQIIGSVGVLRDITEQKAAAMKLEQTMQELKEQTQLMDIIFNNMSDGVVVADEHGEYIMANLAAEQMTGQQLNEMNLSQSSEQYGLFDPTTGALFTSDQLPLARAVKGEATNNIEMRIDNEQLSQEVYVSINGRPLLDENGVSRGGVAVAHNITALKQAQIQLEQTVAELENQTQLMEVVFNNMSDGVVVADDQGRYVMFNQTAQQMTGHRLEPMDIKDAPKQLGFFHPDEKTPFPADQLPLVRTLRGEESANVNIFMHNPKMQEGLHISTSARPLRNAQGVVTGGVSVSRDVTKLRQAEIELKKIVSQLEEQGNLMESIFNSISDGVVVTDANGAFTIFNPSAEKIIGRGAVDATPDHWSDEYGLFFPDRVTPFPTDELPLTRALKGEVSDEVEMFVRNPKVPDGVFISVSGRPLRDETGTQKGGVIVFRNVTHRVIAEEALTQAFAQGRLEIVETILHNIGNAINSVTVGLNVLQENVVGNQLIHRFSALADMVKTHQADWGDYIKNDPKGQQVLPFMIALASDFTTQNKKMVETLERVNERVTHIIDIIRTQKSSNQSSMTRKTINLQQVIWDTVKLQHDSIDKRGIQVDVDCENAPQEIQIQESQFQQMLVNLLKNSIEAIDERMQSGGLNEAPRIEIKTYIREDFLCLDVTDNGIGIEQKNSRLIFNAGYTTKQSGTGLGLHSSANFVIGSGGKIYPLSDGIGKGTTMRIMMRRSSILP